MSLRKASKPARQEAPVTDSVPETRRDEGLEAIRLTEPIQAEMSIVGIQLYSLATKLHGLGKEIAGDDADPLRVEVSAAAMKFAHELADKADHLVTQSRLTARDVWEQWYWQEHVKARGPWCIKPALGAFPPTEIGSATVEIARDALFEAGLESHRLGRRLYFAARRFELPKSCLPYLEFGEDPPNPYYLPFDVAESADAQHGELWRIGNQLIAASKATAHASSSHWRRENYDEDRILEG